MIIDNININYNYINNNSKKTIVLLHGWGQNTIMMEPIEKYFQNKVNVLNIDLPGFGKSDEPKEVCGVEDYADIVYKLIEKLKLKNLTVVGHSFGGRVAIVYAAKYNIDNLVLCSAPFLKRISKENLKVKMLKSAKKIPGIKRLESFVKKRIGSVDYRNASELRRKILVETVNQDLTEFVKKINCPTILIYGLLDTDVPLEEGKQLESIIDDAYFVEYPGTHYAYYEDINRTNKIIENLIGEEE